MKKIIVTVFLLSTYAALSQEKPQASEPLLSKYSKAVLKDQKPTDLGQLAKFSTLVQKIIVGYLNNWYLSEKLKAHDGQIHQIAYTPDNALVTLGIDELEKSATADNKDHKETRTQLIKIMHDNTALSDKLEAVTHIKGIHAVILDYLNGQLHEKWEPKNYTDWMSVAQNGIIAFGTNHPRFGLYRNGSVNYFEDECQLPPTDNAPIIMNKVVLSPCGSYLRTETVRHGDAEIAKLWDLSGKQPAELIELTDSVEPQSANFSHDGKYIAAQSKNWMKRSINIYDIKEKKVIQAVENVGHVFTLSPTGRYLAIGQSNGMVHLYGKNKTWKFSREIGKDYAEYYPLSSLLFSPNEQFVAWITSDKQKSHINLVDLHNNRTYSYEITKDDLHADLRFSKNSQFLFAAITKPAVAGVDECRYKLKVINTATDVMLEDIGDSNMPFTCSVLGIETSFDPNGGNQRHKFRVAAFPYALSPDNKYVALGSKKGDVYFWKNQAEELAAELKLSDF